MNPLFALIALLVLLVSCGETPSKNGKNIASNSNNGMVNPCGNGELDPGESCDSALEGEGACPTSCAAPACSIATLIGSSDSCDATCEVSPVACTDGDGCCPTGCDRESDNDCTNLCGDGAVQEPEVCDGDCPTSCASPDACNIGELTGDAETCSSVCSINEITACMDGDGCCPSGCDGQDTDCVVAPMCGDGAVDAGELCDGNCPTSCDDADACTNDTLLGDSDNCDARCNNDPITACRSGDGCCPTNCEFENDRDCMCEPTTCQQQGLECGASDDGCGMSLSCGTCPNGETCDSGRCVDVPAGGEVGSACVSDANCSGNSVCRTGWPGGYCTSPCLLNNDLCPGTSVCFLDIFGGDALCAVPCTSAADCRPEYKCELDLLTQTMGCIPN